MDSEDIRVSISEFEDPKDLSLGGLVRVVVRVELMLKDIKENQRFIQSNPNFVSIFEILQGKLNGYYKELDYREQEYRNGK